MTLRMICMPCGGWRFVVEAKVEGGRVTVVDNDTYPHPHLAEAAGRTWYNKQMDPFAARVWAQI